MKEFEVNGMTYRPKHMSPSEILALESVVSFSDIDAAKHMFDSFLERIEVKIADVWTPVKVKGSDNLTPVTLNEDLHSLYKICTQFMKIVIEPVFQKSEELKKSQ